MEKTLPIIIQELRQQIANSILMHKVPEDLPVDIIHNLVLLKAAKIALEDFSPLVDYSGSIQ